jgi:hypothetical protein
MAKVEISIVADVCKKRKMEPSLLREIIEELNEITAPAADEDIAPPAPKKQYVILISDMEGKLPKKDLTGWIVQIPENASPYSTTERIFKGAYDFNASKKGRLLPVKSVGEALESASAKYFKESELWVRTKMPIAVVVTDNCIPKDEFKVEKVDRRRKLDEVPAVSDKVDYEIRLGGALVFSTQDPVKADLIGDPAEAAELVRQAFEILKAEGQISIAMIQRRLRLGYNRGSAIMDALAGLGVVEAIPGNQPGPNFRKPIVDLATYTLPTEAAQPTT